MANHYDFEGRVALVTGGASGIGAAVVERLGEGGADVHVFDLSQGDDVRDSANTASTTIPVAGAASGALSNLETAWAREQRQQCRSRGNRQRNSVWDFRTIHWARQGTRPAYEARYRGGVQRGQC